MDRRGGLGKRQTINTNKNENLIVNLICSEEDNPGSHMSPREYEKKQRYKPYFVRQIIKRRGWMQFKSLKTTIISSGTQERRAKRAGVLADRFRKISSVKKMCMARWKGSYFGCSFKLSKQSCPWIWNKDKIQDNRSSHQITHKSNAFCLCIV